MLFGCKVVSELLERPLASFSDVSFGCINVRSILVDGSVGEMSELVVKVVHGVLVCSEPDQAFFINVELQRTHRSQQYVDSHVPFVASDQEWSRQVFLQHSCCVVAELADVVEQVYFATSA